MTRWHSVRQAVAFVAGGVLAPLVASATFIAPEEAPVDADASPIGGVYAEGGWSTLHRSPANRKFVPSAPLRIARTDRHLLEGAAILTAPTFTPDGETFFVTTGQGEGASNLHAFDREGTPLWRAPAWTDPAAGVDPCAILSSPIVDAAGDVYIGDCNQLFAFHADGRSKWTVDLPPTRDGDWIVSEALPVNALTTAVFTRDGDVFGVTNFGDVVVFDRATGRRLNDDLRLPGHVPPESGVMPRPPSIFEGGLVAEAIREWAWQLLAGGAMPSANTPAVDVETGRIFVAATSTTEGLGALHALDLETQGQGEARRVVIRTAFVTDMGPGSGSSPTLSPARDRVYVSDENGVFYGIDARAGSIVWQVDTKATSAAAAVGGNGDVYALQAFGPALIAMREDGTVRWESELAHLAKARLPKSFWLGEPQAIGNGNPTVVGGNVVVPVVYGYETKLFGRTIPWPVESALVEIDGATGRGIGDFLELPDDSTGITVVLADGTILSSLGTALTSGVAPLYGLADRLLPGDRKALRASGGLLLSRPWARPVDAMAERVQARVGADPEKDGLREPLTAIALSGIESGDRVADLMAGDGWWSEVLAAAVGPEGHVVSQNSALVAERYGERIAERRATGGLEGVEEVVQELDELDLGSQRFDSIFLALFYHDTVWMALDRVEMNRRIFEALRPGGTFVVIDHRAEAAAGTSVVESLHRIAPRVVEKEVTAAGFVLEDVSPHLRNPADDLSRSAFDPELRGRTDRFFHLYRKPEAE
ncbi:MAG: PQQ-binding-like beta-propeller repeat protein [bacterium]|nr:PQQ-binding-like beta-propeller repeat protein [bacterium]